ncbi:MAG: hypothetical protein EXR59_00960 [Dehalococcoidia bacterium]|nr:hypothetical protein [Dehalococcoidia bacterium]
MQSDKSRMKMFPDLNRFAFVNRDGEFAWKREHTLKALEWLRNNSFATLGWEAWIIEGGTIIGFIKTSRGSETHGYAGIVKESGETWPDFVKRSSEEITGTLTQDKWPADALVPESNVYFNITYVNQGEYLSLYSR